MGRVAASERAPDAPRHDRPHEREVRRATADTAPGSDRGRAGPPPAPGGLRIGATDNPVERAALADPGRALDPAIRARIGHGFLRSLGEVRAHDGPRAARALGTAEEAARGRLSPWDFGSLSIRDPSRGHVGQGRRPARQVGLRQLPGGPATRQLRLDLSFAPPSGLPAACRGGTDVPPSVSAAVGPFGANLLRAALDGGRDRRPPAEPRPLSLAGLGKGTAIAPEVRAPFERSFGYDLSAVRIHRGPRAEAAAAAANAAAFTVGDHIAIGRGLELESAAGRRIIGHELAHSVQARFGGGSGRISDPSWTAETEAERASRAALEGQPFEITSQAGDDLHRVAPWLILAGIGLAAGLITWGVSDSPEENVERHRATGEDPSHSPWALVPIYGSIAQIREAESYFQRVLGVGFLMLDFASLGSAGIAARALLRAPAALIRTAVTRRAGTLVVRGGGEIATEAAAREAAEVFAREGGAIFASRQAAEAEMMQALRRGSLVAVTEGGLNHAVIYARNAAGQLLRVHGGPLRVLFGASGRELTSEAVSGIARRANSYFVIEAGEAAVSIEQIIARVGGGWPAILRWIGGRPTSCGIMQAAIIEGSGLSAQAAARLLPSGAAARLLPITIMEQAASAGALRLVEGGMTRIIGGTLLQGLVTGAGGSIPLIMSTLMRFVVNEAVAEPGESSGPTGATVARPPVGAARGRFATETDAFAAEIIRRFGAVPVGPVDTIQAALPSIIPGWWVRNDVFRQELAASLIAAGMAADIAEEVALGR